MEKNIIHVTPEISELNTIKNSLLCPEGCKKVFQNTPSLDLHLSQVCFFYILCLNSNSIILFFLF